MLPLCQDTEALPGIGEPTTHRLRASHGPVLARPVQLAAATGDLYELADEVAADLGGSQCADDDEPGQ